MRKAQKVNVKMLVVLSVFAALALVSVAVIRIPVVSFLKYEPKDCVIAIAGFIYGPGAAALITVAVSLVEMLTFSDTGIIGFFMNVLATLLFVMPSALMYKRSRSLKSAVVGLAVGAVCMTAGMILWNYIITPWYMQLPREDVAAMLVPVFLPFNLLKAGLNTAITLLLYKRVVLTLRKTGLLVAEEISGKGVLGNPQKKSISVPVIVGSLALLLALVLVLILWRQ